MKLLFRLCVASLGLACASGADLNGIKTVYLLPMSAGLDQFLANRLTTGAILQVVTDPQKADAILTDRIGTAFEEKLDELYNVKPKNEDKAQDQDQDKDANKARPPIDFSKPATMQPLAHGKGAIFLVDRKTRNVVWSTYALPKGNAPDEMNHLADKIAMRLEKDRKGK